ncbi:type II toxin-antitoxin system death-on-curing family toxin (plasmid) [Mycolicibacterium aichiense]|uniref:type II toxin-antitoxin system death-on-curing family toxin n=1 Tax=Mycolicibacterium aichiense TaxID=1799 RepID=UPI003D66A04C
MTVIPTAEEFVIAAEHACGFHPVVSDAGLLESSVIRPAMVVKGTDAYPTVWDKAAAVLHSFATSRCFVQGNKRAAWAACWLLLGMNGVHLAATVDVDAAEKLVRAVTAGELTWQQIAERLPEFAE